MQPMELTATLMQRGLNLDVLECPKCENRMTVLSAIRQADVANEIRDHLNIPTHPEHHAAHHV